MSGTLRGLAQLTPSVPAGILNTAVFQWPPGAVGGLSANQRLFIVLLIDMFVSLLNLVTFTFACIYLFI